MFQTVMIADDSIPLHSLVKVQLQEHCLSFHSVYDGADAVSAAAALRPDLILLDVDMPRMDGFEACRRIKANPNTSNIPLIFVSADALAADQSKGLGLGAVGYIVKPFRPNELASKVRSSLEPVSVSANAGLTDSLSGLWNKNYFDAQLKTQVKLAQTSGEPLACTVVEIDQLKHIASKFGNKAVNQFVRRIAGSLFRGFAPESAACRLSDHRFAFLTKGTDRFDAAIAAEQLRVTVEKSTVFDHAGVHVTCSFGICDSLIASGETLLSRAATTAKRAVNRGGNCVSLGRIPAKSSTAA